MSDFKHTCKYEQIDEYTFKCSICDKEKMPKELVKDLERQLAEAREEIKDLHDIKNRMFSIMQMAYVDHEAFKPLFESMCNMIKEEIKE